MSEEVYYLVTGEKFLPDGNIEKIRSAYAWSEFMSAQSLITRCLIDSGYSKMQIEVKPLQQSDKDDSNE